MMLACRYMEQAGIRTVVVSSEAPGIDGYDFPLFYTVPEADAIVSVGSEDGIVTMPEVGRVIGTTCCSTEKRRPAARSTSRCTTTTAAATSWAATYSPGGLSR